MCLNDAIEQCEKVSSSDALGTFWKIISGLIQDGELGSSDFDIQNKWTETKVSKDAGENKLTEIKFDHQTRIIYIDFDRAYQKYMERHRQVFSMVGLGLQTMMDYTHNHWSYVGLKASHYFSGGRGKRTSAHMFNYDMLVRRGVMYDMDATNFEPVQDMKPDAPEAPVAFEAKEQNLPF